MIKRNKNVSTTCYIEPEQNKLLDALKRRTKVPKAERIRQGIDLVLQKYMDEETAIDALVHEMNEVSGEE